MEVLGEGVCKLLHHLCTCVLEEGATPSVLLLFVLLASWGSGPSREGKEGGSSPALTTMHSRPCTAPGPSATLHPGSAEK